MKLFARISSFLLFVLSVSFSSHAQQLAGGSITYKCLGNDVYQINMQLSAKCPNSLPPSVSITMRSNSLNQTFPYATLLPAGADQTVTACPGAVSACNGGTGPGADAIVTRNYSGNVTLPKKLTDWIIELQTLPRMNLSSVSEKNSLMYLVATINNTGTTCNNGVVFGGNPNSFSTVGQSTTLDLGLSNPDKDQLDISPIAPKITSLSNVTYSSPYSPSQPISTSGSFAIDPSTGKMTFSPSAAGETSTIAIQVKETVNGVVVGTVMKEIYLQTQSAPTSPPTGGGDIKICQAATSPLPTITFTGFAGSTSAKANIIWNNKSDWGMSSADSNRKFTIVRGQGSATLRITGYTGTLPFTKKLDVTILDDQCGKVNKTVQVSINPSPVVPAIKPKVVLCLNDFSVTENVTGGTPPYSFDWGDPSQTSNVFKITKPGTYPFVVTDATGCTARGTEVVSSPINFDIGYMACSDNPVTFYDISKGNLSIPPSLPPTKANPQDTTKTWTWDFGDGTVDNSNTPSPTHKFPSGETKTYPVTMTVSDGKGCSSHLTLNVKIYGKPKPSFFQIDSCVVTESSDLKVLASVISDTTLTPPNGLVFTVKDPVPTVYQVGGTLGVNNLKATVPGTYIVSLKATNDAGCIGTFADTLKVVNRPFFIPVPTLVTDYFYRCDSPGFPDTTFNFKATAVDKAYLKSKLLSVTVLRNGASDPSFLDSSYTSFKVPFTVDQTVNVYQLTVRITDANNCHNDTTITIYKPNIMNPPVLKKYYCFVGDTLKLRDYKYDSKSYHWGLKQSLWVMQDGHTDSTRGYVNHAYDASAKSLDEAIIIENTTDSTGCMNSDSVQVYLSEPDTNQFSIVKAMACYADTVHIFGIKNKYINSWYYRYQNQPELIFDSPDKVITNPTFGTDVPNVDAIKFFQSNKYTATTSIFYNEPDASLDFKKLVNGQVIIPRQPDKVCHYEVSRNWKIVDKMPFALSNNYDHCYDSLKVFSVDSVVHRSSETQLDTASWVWSLYSPKNVLLDSSHVTALTGLVYQPNPSLFTTVATTRPNYPDPNSEYLPYTIKVKYRYKSDTIYCLGDTSMKVANEKVQVGLEKSNPITCSFYTEPYALRTHSFYEGIYINGGLLSELDSTIWSWGDTSPNEKGQSKPHTFPNPGKYVVRAFAKNYYGCTASDSLLVTVKPSPKADLGVGPVCLGRESVLDGSKSTAADGSSIAKYFWYYSNPIPMITPNIPDTNHFAHSTTDSVIKEVFSTSTFVGLAVEDANGCFDTTQVKLSVVNVLPSVDFTATAKLTNDQDYLGNEPIIFDPTTQNVSAFTWKMGDGKSIIPSDTSGIIEYTYPYYTVPPHPLSDNIYNVTLEVTTSEGCLASVSKVIDVNAYFVLPNAFSPNDDGLHDQLLGVGKGIKEIKEFKIFNRWGEVIYSVTGKPDKDALKRGYLLWDGVYNGQVQPVGAYVYYAVVTTGYGDEIIRKGNLTLMK